MNKYGLKASHVIATARKYKNYQEKYKNGTRNQLWDFHWAAGSANYTIWAVLYKDYTGENYQAQPWCAVYVSDIVVLALIEYCGLSQSEAVKAAKELCGGSLIFNCQLFINKNKGDKRLNHTPKVGSPVIFHTGSKYGHIGLVTGVDSNGKGFTSIEGNTSGGFDKVDPDGGAVVEKYHSLNSRTYFWHYDYIDEKEQATETYKISTGKDGLEITADSLNIRTYADGAKTNLSYKLGEKVFPTEKTFIDGKPWYKSDKGWFAARYVKGWVCEDNGRWWYVLHGYDFMVNNWQLIDNNWYYFDNTGYMVSTQWIQHNGEDYYMTKDGSMARNAYIKSADKDLYYWVGDNGVWRPDTSAPDLDKYDVVV